MPKPTSSVMTMSMTTDAVASMLASTSTFDIENSEGCLPCEKRAQEAAARTKAKNDREMGPEGAEGTYTIEAETDDLVAPLQATTSKRQPLAGDWQGVIGVEGEMTGDGRYIEHGALTWDELPIPLRYVSSDVGAHNGAETVGTIDHIERSEPNEDGSVDIYAWGTYDLESPAGMEAARQCGKKLMPGVSMDLDNVSFEIKLSADAAATLGKQTLEVGEPDEEGRVKVQSQAPDDEVMVTTGARIRGATQVSIPAFARAKLQLDNPEMFFGLVASAGYLEISDELFEQAWDAGRVIEVGVRDDGVITYELDTVDDQTFNWVDDVGGLPKFIKRIEKHLEEKGMAKGHAIAVAVNIVKKMCATGDTNFPGKQEVNAGSRAEACKAVAEWEEKKARAKADAGETQGYTAKDFAQTVFDTYDEAEAAKTTEAPVAPAADEPVDGIDQYEQGLELLDQATDLGYQDPGYVELLSKIQPLYEAASKSGDLDDDTQAEVDDVLARLDAFLQVNWDATIGEKIEGVEPVAPLSSIVIRSTGKGLIAFNYGSDTSSTDTKERVRVPEGNATGGQYLETPSSRNEHKGETKAERQKRLIAMALKNALKILEKIAASLPPGAKLDMAELKKNIEAGLIKGAKKAAEHDPKKNLKPGKGGSEDSSKDSGSKDEGGSGDTGSSKSSSSSRKSYDEQIQDISNQIDDFVKKYSKSMDAGLAKKLSKISARLSKRAKALTASAGPELINLPKGQTMKITFGADGKPRVSSGSGTTLTLTTSTAEFAGLVDKHGKWHVPFGPEGGRYMDMPGPALDSFFNEIGGEQNYGGDVDKAKGLARAAQDGLSNNDAEAAVDNASKLVGELEAHGFSADELEQSGNEDALNSFKALDALSALDTVQLQTAMDSKDTQIEGIDNNLDAPAEGEQADAPELDVADESKAGSSEGVKANVEDYDAIRENDRFSKKLRDIDLAIKQGVAKLPDTELKAVSEDRGEQNSGQSRASMHAMFEIQARRQQGYKKAQDSIYPLGAPSGNDPDEVKEQVTARIEELKAQGDGIGISEEAELAGLEGALSIIEREIRIKAETQERRDNAGDSGVTAAMDDDVATEDGLQASALTADGMGAHEFWKDPRSGNLMDTPEHLIGKFLDHVMSHCHGMAEELHMPLEQLHEDKKIVCIEALDPRMPDAVAKVKDDVDELKAAAGNEDIELIYAGGVKALQNDADGLKIRLDDFLAARKAGLDKAFLEEKAKEQEAREELYEAEGHMQNMTATELLEVLLEGADPNYEAETTTLTASAGQLPSVNFFSNPRLKGPTPLTVTEDGRVYGHLATWGTCHLSHTQAGKCVEPPRSKQNYAYFHTGAVLTDSGEVSVGQITLNTGHANELANAKATLAHYDNTGLQVADVRAGEDSYGIWVSGLLRDTATEQQKKALRASPLSGDWRRIGGNLELVAALAVTVPGFPIPRPKGMVASGAMQSLVAAGMLAPQKVAAETVEAAKAGDQLSLENIRYLKMLAEREKKHQEAMAAEAEEHEKIKAEAATFALKLKAKALAEQLNKQS